MAQFIFFVVYEIKEKSLKRNDSKVNGSSLYIFCECAFLLCGVQLYQESTSQVTIAVEPH